MVDMAIRQGVGVADPNSPDNWLVPSWSNAAAITLSDATIYSPTLKALYIGTTGNVAVTMAGNGVNVTFNSVPVGWLWVNIKKVLSTGTTASNITGVW